MTEKMQKTTDGSGELVITRVLDAPRDLVFKVWTQAEHLAKWWGPKGLALRVEHLDFSEGGRFHYCMIMPNGQEMWGLFVYHEISAPERFVFVNSFADASGAIIRAPFSPHWPLEVRNTLTLTEENGKTTLTLRGAPHNATEEEYQLFMNSIANMEQGFGGTFEQLVAYLETLR